MADNALKLSRISAHVMKTLINHFSLGQQAEHFVGDDPDMWAVESPTQVAAIIGSRRVATLEYSFDDPHALPVSVIVIVINCFDLIRGQHMREFDPHLHGIAVNNTFNWMNEKEPDIDVTLQLPDLSGSVPGLELPRRTVPRRQLVRKVKVKPSNYGGSRGA